MPVTEMNMTNHPSPVREINKCVRVRAGDVFLLGDLHLPEESTALVLFAYGSGRSRNNPRLQHMAQMLRAHGIGTLSCELLTEDEEIDDEATERFRHDAELLAKRLVQVTEWASQQPETKDLPMGYFGACAGGAAAIIAAAKLKSKVRTVVSRGGRMDLAVNALPKVQCPTLLIVGAQDTVGMELNREALPRMSCEKQLVEIAGAGHQFGEPGKFEEMAELSARWFHDHLGAVHHPV